LSALLAYIGVSYLISLTTLVDNKGVGMVHKLTSPKKQLQFSQALMGQHYLGQYKLSNKLKMLSKITAEFLKPFIS